MHIHLVGIGGAGLSAIARVLLGMGYIVSGSDLVASEMTELLAAEGATVSIGHAAGQEAGAELLLVSSAIPPNNPEVKAARAAGVPIVKRDRFLGELMAERKGIAVAGTHGKTTTSAMVASILMAAELDPSFIVGGVLKESGSNARAGRGDLFVIEADEYDRMFLGLRPQAVILTVVEHDHPDCYPTLDEMMDAYRAFLHQLPPDGLLVACFDDPGARELGQERLQSGGLVCWYGLDEMADWRATDVQLNQAGGSDFVLLHAGEAIGLVRLKLPGQHNILNALAAHVLMDWLGVPFNVTRSALAGFAGVGRRFDIKGQAGGVLVVDDYAHHPTEIRATLAAARARHAAAGLEGRIWAVFQPHTYSRTHALMDQFAQAFDDADHVLVLDIYAARETDTLGVSAANLVARMAHPGALYVGGRRQAADYLLQALRPGDTLLTLGAGDGDMVGTWVLAELANGNQRRHNSDGA